jgi:hypothetical protein
MLMLKDEVTRLRDELSNLASTHTQLAAEMDAIKARPVVKGCRATARTGFATIPLSCALVF